MVRFDVCVAVGFVAAAVLHGCGWTCERGQQASKANGEEFKQVCEACGYFNVGDPTDEQYVCICGKTDKWQDWMADADKLDKNCRSQLDEDTKTTIDAQIILFGLFAGLCPSNGLSLAAATAALPANIDMRDAMEAVLGVSLTSERETKTTRKEMRIEEGTETETPVSI